MPVLVFLHLVGAIVVSGVFKKLPPELCAALWLQQI